MHRIIMAIAALAACVSAASAAEQDIVLRDLLKQMAEEARRAA